jgi:hypothetical protein
MLLTMSSKTTAAARNVEYLREFLLSGLKRNWDRPQSALTSHLLLYVDKTGLNDILALNY